MARVRAWTQDQYTVRLCLLSPSQVWGAQRSPETLQLDRGRGKERPRSGFPHLQKSIVGTVGVAPDCSKRLRRRVLLWGHPHYREGVHSSGQRQNCAGTTQVRKGRGATSGLKFIFPLLQLLVHDLECGFILHQHRLVLPLSPHPPGGLLGEVFPPQPWLSPSQNRSGYSCQSASDVARYTCRRPGWPPSPGGEETHVSIGSQA